MYFEIGHDCLLHVIRSLQLIIIVSISTRPYSLVASYVCYRSVGFEVYTAVEIIVLAFWVMTPCSLVAGEHKPVLQFSLPAPCMLVTKLGYKDLSYASDLYSVRIPVGIPTILTEFYMVLLRYSRQMWDTIASFHIHSRSLFTVIQSTKLL